MSENNKFGLEEYLKTVKKFKDIEVSGFWEMKFIECMWYKMTCDEIAERLCCKKFHYKKSYLCRELALDLFEKVSNALNMTVKKTNFVETIEQKWMIDNRAKFFHQLTPIDRFTNFLIDTTWSNQTSVSGTENQNNSLNYTAKSIIFRNAELEVIRGTFRDKTLSQIADNTKRSICVDNDCKEFGECSCSYKPESIKDIAKKAWERTTEILGKRVTKKNLKDIVKQWLKNMQLFIWKLTQVAISLETKNIICTEDSPAKTQRSDFYVLTIFFLLLSEADYCE